MKGYGHVCVKPQPVS